MNGKHSIPAFGLYGEADDVPDILHHEALADRAPKHDWRIHAHRHERIAQLFLIDDGPARVTVDDANWELSNASFLFVPALTVHAFDFRPGTKGSVFSFPAATVQSIAPSGSALLAVLSKPCSGTVTEPLRQTVRLLRNVAESQGTFRPHLAVSLIHASLGFVAEAQNRHGADDITASETLQALDDLVYAHQAEGFSASDYARALSISTGHLSRLCRRATGSGASAYVERKLMGEACRLLAFTQLPVSEIGYRVGYGDPSYFSKRFRRAIGQSPLSYRGQFTNRMP